MPHKKRRIGSGEERVAGRDNQARLSCRRRTRNANPIRPAASSDMLPGSGTAWTIETPSSNENGGSPLGVPAARNERTSDDPVAVKVRLA